MLLAEICSVLGLDLSVRVYPGSRPLRDSRHAGILARLQRHLHRSLGWGTEVPLPSVGDRRSFDGLIRGPGWRFAVEAELNPIDGQAMLRRLALKRRDGDVDGLILLLPDTRQTRWFRREYAELLAADFPLGAAEVIRALESGQRPAANGVVVMRQARSLPIGL